MEKHRVKIRGIYSTALTKLLLDLGYSIADPSPEIQQRFRLDPAEGLFQALIRDSEDHQGVDIFGEADAICELLGHLQPALLDAALLRFEPSAEWAEELPGDREDASELVRARLEFGGSSKGFLDLIRSSVVPSLSLHHRFKIIHPRKLQRLEKELWERPQAAAELDRRLFEEEILVPLSKAGVVCLEHVKISGKPVRPREGVLMESGGGRILVKRSFSQHGRYDGLDLPIEPGDYSLVEVREGDWSIKHAYYSQAGVLKGEYWNVNTPVELYPYGARYLDLEIDVIRRPGEAPFIVDREELAILAKDGLFGPGLEKKALETAEGLLKSMC